MGVNREGFAFSGFTGIGGGAGRGCFNVGEGVRNAAEISGEGIPLNAPASGRIGSAPRRFGPATGSFGRAMLQPPNPRRTLP